MGARRVAVSSCARDALHPVMALGRRRDDRSSFSASIDRRWLVAGAAACVFCVAGALLGAPLFERLTTPIDPQWLAMLRGPDDYLFPTTWPERAWSLFAERGATVALAAVVSQGAARRLVRGGARRRRRRPRR